MWKRNVFCGTWTGDGNSRLIVSRTISRSPNEFLISFWVPLLSKSLLSLEESFVTSRLVELQVLKVATRTREIVLNTVPAVPPSRPTGGGRGGEVCNGRGFLPPSWRALSVRAESTSLAVVRPFLLCLVRHCGVQCCVRVVLMWRRCHSGVVGWPRGRRLGYFRHGGAALAWAQQQPPVRYQAAGCHPRQQEYGKRDVVLISPLNLLHIVVWFVLRVFGHGYPDINYSHCSKKREVLKKESCSPRSWKIWMR